ncbi:unnamed protein product [Cyprideis torosa]|uniref:FAD/NAD(P)-binding domain-containing protein n=1 Tax=Cyprideis torosa TaxID=163714 RepID=A0A7R8WU41_9CRUS|nr:unnamed protein product [Cyprideis torosa]CAG0910053.1 unnamed protein product [Cyprideis torosa]
MLDNHHKVVIVGSGPAGLTAAIYTARANLKPVIYEGMQPGGQLTITTEVENYPGFEEGIQGPELMDVMRKQALRFGAKSEFKEITEVDFSSRPFKLKAESQEISADSVIISTGASAKLLGISKNTLDGTTEEMPADGIFMAIGHKPNTAVFGDQLEKDETGYLIVKPGSTYTNVEGVFAAGDVADKTYRQAVTAAGTGCMAALDAQRWLEDQE